MAADVNVILLAAEGLEEAEHDLHRMIFAAQGLDLPPLERLASPKGQRPSADQIKAWARVVNAQMAAKKRAAKSEKERKLTRDGGGAPPRKSKRRPRTAR